MLLEKINEEHVGVVGNNGRIQARTCDKSRIRKVAAVTVFGCLLCVVR